MSNRSPFVQLGKHFIIIIYLFIILFRSVFQSADLMKMLRLELDGPYYAQFKKVRYHAKKTWFGWKKESVTYDELEVLSDADDYDDSPWFNVVTKSFYYNEIHSKLSSKSNYKCWKVTLTIPGLMDSSHEFQFTLSRPRWISWVFTSKFYSPKFWITRKENNFDMESIGNEYTDKVQKGNEAVNYGISSFFDSAKNIANSLYQLLSIFSKSDNTRAK